MPDLTVGVPYDAIKVLFGRGDGTFLPPAVLRRSSR